VITELLPHIRIRLKQLFPGVPKTSLPPYTLKDNPATAADLNWFMSRWPLEIDTPSIVHLNEQVENHSNTIRNVQELSRPDYQPPLITGFRNGYAPYPYQARAVELWRATGRLLLLDDVGLGKTVTALAGICEGWGLPAVVVVQPHLSQQWIMEYIRKFTHLSAHEVKDRNPRTLPEADIYVFRYSNIGAWVDYAEVLGCKTIIFDEIQELRHGDTTEKGKAAKIFCGVADNVIGLTATPIYNYGDEIFNVVEFVSPGALGSWYEFLLNWCDQRGNRHIVHDPRALGSYLRDEGIVLRRLYDSEEVALELPELRKMVVEVGWNEGDVESNVDLQIKLAMRVLHGSFHESGASARELDMMLRHDTGVAKARAVAGYVRNLLSERLKKVVLFGWHRDVYDIWLRELLDFNPVMFTGSETGAAKAKSIQAFTSSESRLLIMSLRSGAGIDGLQYIEAHDAVFGELDWSPKVHDQCIGRLRRFGQKYIVTAHFLHVNGGSDPVLMDVLGLKSSQSKGIVDPFDDVSEATTEDTSRMVILAKSILAQLKEDPSGNTHDQPC
jgi:SNF2 family DNA or RNA helicase